jgi:hypothetical protein
MPSCYAADGFASVASNLDNPFLVIAGLMSSGACLATAIDGFHRQHTSLFVSDASWSPPLGSASAEESNDFASEVIRQYSDVMTTRGLIEWLSRESFERAS